MIFSFKRTLPIVLVITTLISCGKDEDPDTISQPEPEPELLQWYLDSDTDGFGNPDVNLGIKAETKPDGYVSDNTDCDDNEITINPDAEEDEYDGIDSNCDNGLETVITTFSKTFGDNTNELETSSFLYTALDGGYLSVGTVISFQPENFMGKRDFWIVKLDSEGNKVWEKNYGGPEEETLWSAKQTSDGGLILCGDSMSEEGNVLGNAGENDWWILKVDATGVIEWVKTIGGSQVDKARDIIQVKNGGYLVVGDSQSNDGDFVNSSNAKSWFIKLDNNGNVEWKSSADGATADNVIELEDGSFLAVGNVSISNETNVLQVFKLTSAGQILWTQNIEIDGDSVSSSQILLDPNQNILVSGYVFRNSEKEGLLLNITQTADKNWVKFINDNYILNTIKTTIIDDSYLITSSMRNTSSNNSLDLWLGKYDLEGNQMWTKFYGGSGSDFPGGLIQTPDSGFIMSASTSSFDGDILDREESDNSLALWLFKLKPNFKF